MKNTIPKFNKNNITNFKYFLEEMYLKYNNKNFIKSDPIKIPHLFSKKEDIEISAFITSIMSWGKRKIIIKKSQEIINIMEYQPYDFIMNHTTKDLNMFNNFKHRTLKNQDIIFIIKSLKNIYKKYKNLSSIFFIQKHEINTIETIIRARKIILSIPHENRINKHICDPVNKSACKKINMFLRWLVRKDKNNVDLGIWRHIPTSKLLCPLDVHSGRIARKLNLVTINTNNIYSLIELNNNLRLIDKKDPSKYDFALFGIGISNIL